MKGSSSGDWGLYVSQSLFAEPLRFRVLESGDKHPWALILMQFPLLCASRPYCHGAIRWIRPLQFKFSLLFTSNFNQSLFHQSWLGRGLAAVGGWWAQPAGQSLWVALLGKKDGFAHNSRPPLSVSSGPHFTSESNVGNPRARQIPRTLRTDFRIGRQCRLTDIFSIREVN